jgi:hypothetical protein
MPTSLPVRAVAVLLIQALPNAQSPAQSQPRATGHQEQLQPGLGLATVLQASAIAPEFHITTTALSPLGSLLARTSMGMRHAEIWDVHAGVKILDVPLLGSATLDLEFTGGGEKLLARTDAGFEITDLNTMSRRVISSEPTIENGTPGTPGVSLFAASTNGSIVAFASESSGRPILAISAGGATRTMPCSPLSLTVAPGGKHIAVVESGLLLVDTAAPVWNSSIPTRRWMATPRHRQAPAEVLRRRSAPLCHREGPRHRTASLGVPSQ